MAFIKRVRFINWIIAGLALSIIVGCSVSPSDSSNSLNPSKSPNSSTEQKNSKNELLSIIIEQAKQGKVINSEFAAKTTVIEDVKQSLGEPDSSDYVAAAKGTYDTYSKHNLVFGFNKGAQIFEVRSFDNQLKKLTLSEVKEVFGVPAYSAKAKDEYILGYIMNQEYKILLVFPQAPPNTDPVLDHYSVLYPQGTINSMANNPGRQW